MALTNFTDLSVTVKSWLGSRHIQPARFPDWLTLYEVRANRELRARSMEQRSTAPITSEYVALPTDFLEMRNFQLNTDPVTDLQLVSPEYIDAMSPVSGQPRWYAIVNDEIQLSPAPAASYTAEMTYWQRIPALTAAAPTNWLMTKAPDLYLFGTLVEAALDAGQDDLAAKWEARYQRAVASLQSTEDRGKWSGATMRRRIPGIIYADNRSRVRD